MREKEDLCLCGGIFFTLILCARKPRISAKKHYDGESDGLTDPEVLTGLIRVMDPDFPDPYENSMGSIVNRYKSCKISNGAYLPFQEDQVIASFEDTVRHHYPEALNRMIGFERRFLDPSETLRKDVVLVRALIDLIRKDASIGENEAFCIGRNGEEIRKAALGSLGEVCFPAFLLGVWHWIIMNRKNNTVGKATYEFLCPKPETEGMSRKYMASLGKKLPSGPRVFHILPEDEPQETVYGEDIVQELPPVAEPVTVNRPFVFNFTQHGDHNTQIGYVENFFAESGADSHGK